MFSIVKSSIELSSIITSMTPKSFISSSSMTLLLAVLLMTKISSTQAAPTTAITTVEPRWVSPCGGSSRVSGQDGASGSSNQPTTTPGSAQGRNDLRLIIDSARTLRNMVQLLKTKYVEVGRFVNREDANVILANYPEPYLTNIRSPWSIAFETDMILMVAYKDLAQLSLYIERARLGESNAQNQRHSLERQYSEIENHSSGGMYTLLCHVKRAMVHRGLSLSRNAQNELRSITLGSSSSRTVHSSSRHGEDYIILHVLDQLLNDLHTCLSRILVQQSVGVQL